MTAFGNFLYALRKEKGMTQQELAEKLNITNKAVSKWETGEAFPETSQLVPLANIFGVSVDELLRGELAHELFEIIPVCAEKGELGNLKEAIRQAVEARRKSPFDF